jgi:tRNA U34 5-carboxymethylaminomethyl modifying GTPase MnmE/TrmE
LFKKNVAPIGQDGRPTTKTLQIFPDEESKVLYVDSAGLEKHDNEDKFIQLISIRPDLIWLIVNYVSSIEKTELDISTKYFPNTPLILIINKVDILQELNIDTTELNHFDQRVPKNLEGIERLISVRNRLIVYENVHRLILLSLRQEEEHDKPIGLKNLVDVTEQYFNSKTSKEYVGRIQDSFNLHHLI